MKSLKKIRQMNYQNRRAEERTGMIDDWFTSPYSCLKSRYYIEVGSIIVYFLQFTKITPTQVSIFYTFLGIISGVFLSLNNEYLIYSGLVIFIMKGVIDWSDGLLARVTNRVGNLGHIVDVWGTHVSTYSLIFGIGIICFNDEQEKLYLIITLFIFFLNLIDFKFYGYHQIFYEVLKKKIFLKDDINSKKNYLIDNQNFFIKKIKFVVNNFMDDRARTVDLICVIIFIEIFYKTIFLTKIIFFIFLLISVIVFTGNVIEIVILKKLKNKI